MQKIIISSLFLLCSYLGSAQFIYDISDQYIQADTFENIALADFLDLPNPNGCYNLSIQPVDNGGISGFPALSLDEYDDYRENMTVTLKLLFSGLQLDMQPQDRIWILDADENITETNVPFDDPFNAEEKIFYLNVKGNFDIYAAKLVYYNDSLDKYFELEEAFTYGSNKSLGDPQEPFVINLGGPLDFDLDEDFNLTTTIVDTSYTGQYCVTLDLIGCNGTFLDDEEFCFIFSEEPVAPCPINYTVSQADILNATIPAVFAARDNVFSSANIDGNRDVKFTGNRNVELLPGFSVELGVVFEAFIEGCDP